MTSRTLFNNAQTHTDSYYANSIDEAPNFPVLRDNIDVEVCVVGGGFAGLSTAIELAEAGKKVALIEGVKVAWGASGRNGGQIIGGWNIGYDSLASQLGTDSAKMFARMAEEAKNIIYERAARYQIECDIKKGFFLAAIKPAHMDYIEQQAEILDKWTYSQMDKPHKHHLVSAQDVGQYLQTDRYIGGHYNEGNGHLHPLKFALGEARAARDLGVEIYEHSKVIRVDHGDRPMVHTAEGSVIADKVVLCGNCYLENVAPKLKTKIMPAGTYIIATEVLSPEVASTLIPKDMATCDVRNILDYFRLSADKRLLFGGKTTYTGQDPRDIARTMRRDMLKVFPQLKHVKIDYAWGGYIDLAVNRMPHVGELHENVLYTQGFSGFGVAPTQIAGRVLAEKILGKSERYSVWNELNHFTFPGGTLLRKPGFLLGSSYYYLRDFLGR